MPLVRGVALLLLCAAYLQGGFDKAMDFDAAIAEMQHFGLAPAAPLALAVIGLELAAAASILCDVKRWAGALVLAGFTFAANLVANRYWQLAPPGRAMAANAFFEHLGLAGGFLLVAWQDLRERQAAHRSPG
ncbi:DoxX family protein [Frateuria defendens]|uniref:DoxX family protein n=1 Tax=Frateuria defendens TaxID=2219559 RepID=UPI001F23A664|nr:DoxX family protein [Frateuria defendens]